MDKYQIINEQLFIQFLNCKRDAWIKLNQPEIYNKFKKEEENIIDSKQIEGINDQIRKKFYNSSYSYKIVNDNLDIALSSTKKYIALKIPFIFKAVFEHNNIRINCDILEFDKITKKWNIYQILYCSNLKAQKYLDKAKLQFLVLKNCGLSIKDVFIIYLNKEYTLIDKIDLKQLFLIKNITQEIEKNILITQENIKQARSILLNSNFKNIHCECIYKTKSNHCTTFKYSHKYIPAYSIYDISNIHYKKIATLIDKSIYEIENITEKFKFSTNQQLQIKVYKANQPIIKKDLIKKEIKSLEYPLYFLDYETYSNPIPIFKGFKSYMRIPFQFSLHIQRSPNASLEHFEFLHTSKTDPSLDLIKKLYQHIENTGNIIVWYKSFEAKVNEELGDRHKEFKEFLNNINNRIYDLMLIFKGEKGEEPKYIHPKFKGSASLKKVLPALVPECSYAEMSIQDGASASKAWFKMVYDPLFPKEKLKIKKALETYCYLDTYAMYKILDHLINIT